MPAVNNEGLTLQEFVDTSRFGSALHGSPTAMERRAWQQGNDPTDIAAARQKQRSPEAKEDRPKPNERSIAKRLQGVKIGTRFFGGRCHYRDGIPHEDSSHMAFIRVVRECHVVRETAAYWIDSTGWWWRKSDGLHIPRNTGHGTYMVPIEEV